MKLTGKTCLLTGATGGIGEAIAIALDAAGAQLILVGRSQLKLNHLLNQLKNDNHICVSADLTQTEGIETVVQSCNNDIDILINNAGNNHFGLLTEQSEQQIRQMLELNTLAPMLLTKAMLPLLNKQSATIINIGSGFGSIGFAGYCAYSASKFALRGFTEALRRELSDTNTHVLYLAPRATATEMNPSSVVKMNEELGNAMDSPKRVADELMSLLTKTQARRFIGWPERFFVKLNGLLPSVVDSALAKQLPIIKRYAVASSDNHR